jgi:hypothetical protein
MPCFPKSDTEPTRRLTLITSGLESSHLGGLGSIILMVMTTRLMSTVSEGCDAGETYLRASIFLVPTICLHQSLPSTTRFVVLTNCLYSQFNSTSNLIVPTVPWYQWFHGTNYTFVPIVFWCQPIFVPTISSSPAPEPSQLTNEFPVVCEKTQCIICIGNERLPYEQ